MEALSEPEVKQSFYQFVRNFKPRRCDAAALLFGTEGQTPQYLQQLKDIFHQNQGRDVSRLYSFPVDMNHIKTHSVALLHTLLRFPADVLVYLDETLGDLVLEEFRDIGLTAELLQQSGFSFRTAVYNHPRPVAMRDLDPKDIETLISARGVVIRCSSVLPDMRMAVFRCTNKNAPRLAAGEVCGHEERSILLNGEVTEPLQCPRCSGRYTFELSHNRCVYGSKQLLRVQETPDAIPESETPHTILAYVYDDLVDACKPGDFVSLVGIHRAAPIRVVQRMQSVKSVFRTYLDVNSVRRDGAVARLKVTNQELEGPAADAEFDEEDPISRQLFATAAQNDSRQGCETEDFPPDVVAEMKRIGALPDIYSRLVRSLAPNIWEADDVLRGLLCQLFGGTQKVVGDRTARSDIHILLCGDPSTAKSQLLKYVHGLTPRGAYTCGRGSSAVGLTASVVRDPECKEFVLESGAIILSDKGICCIDELDKMDETARTILHEVMEQQTVSIAKAGIVCSLNARAALLASANPIGSRYDPSKSVIENIALPASLISRFDLIYLMLDQANPVVDAALAEHVCQLYSRVPAVAARSPPLDRTTFAKYISYARKYCFPKLTDEAKERIIEAYVSLRRSGFAEEMDGGSGPSKHTVTATPRQLESLIRLSEALAKMELNEKVEPRHVNEADRLMRVATYAALTDPTTGKIDFQQLTAGVSEAARMRREKIEVLLLQMLRNHPQGITKDVVAEKLSTLLRQENEAPVDAQGRELIMLLRTLEDYGKIKAAAGGKYVLILD